jgi:hypothetical protein
MSNSRRDVIRVDWISLWILFSAWCALSGWGLSLIRCLNATGVVGSFVIFGVVVAALWRPLELARTVPARRGYFRRTRRWLPRVWLLLATLSLIGGLLYVPNNYDFLTYRFPRVLNWCWDQGWSWLRVPDLRMNYSGPQFEWMMVPTFVLFKTDRLFFLINFVSYLFLPGLVFSVFRGMGISGRISWWWMWVLPCGGCYILQAASAGNDSFALIYLLAALDYLLRARGSNGTRNLVLSTLAIALLTGAKASNLPLVLPWAILLFFTRAPVLAGAKPVAIAALVVVAAAASFLPLAVINKMHTGDFFGDPDNAYGLKVQHPLGGIVGNALEIGWSNLTPPVWYHQLAWEPHFPAAIQSMLEQDFPRLHLEAREIAMEERSGVGLGCSLGVALFLVVALAARVGDRTLLIARDRRAWWIVAGGVIALLVYMGKIATEAAPRVVAPYYPLLIAGALVLAALDGRVVRWRLFRYAGFAAMALAFPTVILSPSRPLFPVMAAADFLATHTSADLSRRFLDVYSLYAVRAFAFAPVLRQIPATEVPIGLVQDSNAPETSLWRPFGAHRVVEVQADDSAESIRAQNVRWIVVSEDALKWKYHAALPDLLAKWRGRVVAIQHVAMTAQHGATSWDIVELDSP